MRDSAVVCRELGCGGPRQPDPAAGRFGWGAGPIWLDDVGCVGMEASLSECPAASWGKHNCAHNEDVGVTCTGEDTLAIFWRYTGFLEERMDTKGSVNLTECLLDPSPGVGNLAHITSFKLPKWGSGGSCL